MATKVTIKCNNGGIIVIKSSLSASVVGHQIADVLIEKRPYMSFGESSSDTTGVIMVPLKTLEEASAITFI